jgi:hypothetical protein
MKKKVIRLTESQLVNIVKKVIKEQVEKPNYEKGGEEGGKEEYVEEFDYFGKIVVPKMKSAGFTMIDETKHCVGLESYGKGDNCCKYFVYPDNSTAVTLALNCEQDGWYLVVFYQGNKGVKEFEPNKLGAEQAVAYAIQLKNKLYGAK